VALLETASRHAPGGPVLRTIETFWRRGEPGVKRAAIEAILGAGDGARGLELSLCRLADADDARILTQALAAARTLRAGWAEPIVRRALERPEMGVKKEAAEALAEIGTSATIPALVKWLGLHDNDSFRASLLKALQHVAGLSTAAVLVDALDHDGERDARQDELLHRALDGRLTLAAVTHLARSRRSARRAVVEACVAGRIVVAGATADDVAAHLHRGRLLPKPPVDDPARELRLLGFSRDAARRLLALRSPKLDARILPVVRVTLASWLAWIDEEPDAGALALVLDAADRSHAELVDRLLGLVARGPAGPGRAADRPASLPQAAVAGFLERCVAQAGATRAQKVRGLEIVRALPPSAELGGQRRWALLRDLGAVRTVHDLAACLAACRLSPDLAGQSAALLFAALGIPAAERKDEPEALTRLRREARDFYRSPPASGMRWLEAVVLARPLDLPIPDPWPEPPSREPFAPDSQEAFERLRVTLRDDESERVRAAKRILAWPDARPLVAEVLDAYLRGRLEASDFTHDELRTIAGTLDAWPAAPLRARATRLVGLLAPVQVRALLPGWIDAWRAGEPFAEDALRAIDASYLLPWAEASVARGDFTPARLLVADGSPAVRAILALGLARSPRDVEHLRPREEKAVVGEGDGDPVDPIATLGFEGLLAMTRDRSVARGLVVRAVHALGTHGARAAAPLTALAVDRRPPVRSAALRVLRAVSTREETLRVTATVLGMETRKDVIASLMASLGHGRYEPALPILVERLVEGDPHTRASARDALRAWGRDVVPALRHASRRARPDRRSLIVELIAELA